MDSATVEVVYSRTSEHHYFSFAMWQQEVAAGDVQRGYAEWVQAQLEFAAEELAQVETRFETLGGRSIELAEQIDELRDQLGTREQGQQE